MTVIFLLLHLRFFSLSLAFNNLTMMYDSVCVYPTWVYWVPWTCIWMLFSHLGSFQQLLLHFFFFFFCSILSSLSGLLLHVTTTPCCFRSLCRVCHFPSIFFFSSVFLREDNFYYSIFKFMDFFFCHLTSFLKPVFLFFFFLVIYFFFVFFYSLYFYIQGLYFPSILLAYVLLILMLTYSSCLAVFVCYFQHLGSVRINVYWLLLFLNMVTLF